jgi:hypothetical protein
MKLDAIELAWAAGFFDGEGSFITPRNHARLHQMVRATIFQTDPRVLERFRTAVLGIGSITGPYTRRNGKSHWKPHWEWSAQNFEDMQAVGALLWKFLSPVKREQFKLALERFHNRQRGPGLGWNKGGKQTPEWIAKRNTSRLATIARKRAAA